MTPEQYLLAYHARHAGATARTYAAGRTEDGRSTYAILADLPAPGDAVLDLGCGDGYLLELLAARGVRDLVGIDMSAEELALAARRPALALAGVRLLRERAQESSLADRSIDWALSHLAFMLMGELDRVVAELARVLRPGGRFATVVGGGPTAGEEDGFALFLRLFQAVYETCEVRAPRIGDRRIREAAGFAELFNPATGFDSAIEEATYTVRIDGPPELLWERLGMNPIYQMLVVPADAAEELRARFLAEAAALAGPDGVVPCALRCRLLAARRLAT